MSLIKVANLTFAYEGSYDNIFEEVSFKLDTAWKLGFTGRNGRGKTTFLNLLLNKFPYQGTITASCQFEYFPFGAPNPGLVTLDLAASLYAGSQRWALARELSLLETDAEILSRPFCTLSKGEQTKVLLAVLFLKENRFLLIDEPTNHLDLPGRKVVSNYLRGKKGYILVSHDRAFLDGCVDHILSINKTNIEIQKGNFSTWLLNKERQDHFALAKNEKLRKEIKRLEKTAKEKAAWSERVEKSKIGTHAFDRGYIGHKAAKMMKRSKAIEGRQLVALKEKTGLRENIEKAAPLKITQLAYHAGRLAFLDQVSIFYGNRVACQDISLTINQGDRIALWGRNGSGKTSIIKLICGEKLQYTGNFQKGSQLVISRVAQDTDPLAGSLAAFIAANRLDESLFKAILRKLDFSRQQFEKPLEDCSSGQKKKVLLAKSLCEKAHLLIWDEPLNYIDILSRMQIENLLLTYKPTILFVEHDEAFCRNVATKEILL